MKSICWKCKAPFEMNADSVGTCPYCWKAYDPKKENVSDVDPANPPAAFSNISPEQFADFTPKTFFLNEAHTESAGLTPQKMAEVQQRLYEATKPFHGQSPEEFKDELAKVCFDLLLSEAPAGTDPRMVAQMVVDSIADIFKVQVGIQVLPAAVSAEVPFPKASLMERASAGSTSVATTR